MTDPTELTMRLRCNGMGPGHGTLRKPVLLYKLQAVWDEACSRQKDKLIHVYSLKQSKWATYAKRWDLWRAGSLLGPPPSFPPWMT